MISRWHVNVYWYSIVVMGLFLIFLMIPNSVNISKVKSYDKQVRELADKNLKAQSASERAAIARKYSMLEKNKGSNMKSSIINMIPFKVILLIVMSLFVYLILQRIWVRRKPTEMQEET